MRQAGIVAAAGLYALEHHIERLAEDHANASRLAEGLGAIDGVKIDSCATNMVFIRLDDEACDGGLDLSSGLAERGILTRWDGPQSRLVTHLDVSAEDVETAVDAFTELLA